MIFERTTFGRDGGAHTANLWTDDGRHFHGRAKTAPAALLQAAWTAYEAATDRPLIRYCPDCRAHVGATHLNWCPYGPGTVERKNV